MATSTKQTTEEFSENYISIGLGLLVVVVIGLLVYNFFTNRQTQQTSQEQITQEATTSAQPGGTYIVQSGDTLWSISEKAYGTGYNWQDIAKANNLETGNQLESGQELTIPEVTPIFLDSSPSPDIADKEIQSPEPKLASVTASPQTVVEAESVAPAISGNTYTVVKGDSLWKIAERAYGNPYKWVEIAKANSLVNPDLIHPGNVFTLPQL